MNKETKSFYLCLSIHYLLQLKKAVLIINSTKDDNI